MVPSVPLPASSLYFLSLNFLSTSCLIIIVSNQTEILNVCMLPMAAVLLKGSCMASRAVLNILLSLFCCWTVSHQFCFYPNEDFGHLYLTDGSCHFSAFWLRSGVTDGSSLP